MIVGHQKQWLYLRHLFLSKKLPHALLFYGENNIGKRKVAIEFAKFVNCEEEEIEKKPCQKCSSCKAIDNNSFPDFIIIEPNIVSSKKIVRKEIKISQIRELISKISLKNYIAPLKIVIIDDAHLMNSQAQSSFLKALEEPKGNTIFILITPFPRILLPTIISRTEKIRFSPPSREEIYKFLEKKNLSLRKKEELYFFSEGRVGKIIDYLSSPEELEKRKEMLKEIQKISFSSLSEKFNFAQKVSQRKDNVDIKDFFSIFLLYLRTILYSKLGLDSEERELLNTEYLSKKYTLDDLRKLIKLTQYVNTLTSFTNVNLRLNLEILFMRL